MPVQFYLRSQPSTRGSNDYSAGGRSARRLEKTVCSMLANWDRRSPGRRSQLVTTVTGFLGDFFPILAQITS